WSTAVSRMNNLITTVLVACSMAIAAAYAEPVRVVAAENFYGDIAQQIGGRDVKVVSLINNPSQDPHEFEASAATARQIADAQLVIYNGASYDPWMTKLLSGSRSASRIVIEVAKLVPDKIGTNPHIW